MTFEDFIETLPGFRSDAVALYLVIDREAVRVGAQLAVRCTPEEHRARTGSAWLEGFNRDQADALERDPRLAAIPSLRAWAAGPDGIGNTWINLYVALLDAHIEHLRTQVSEAA